MSKIKASILRSNVQWGKTYDNRTGKYTQLRILIQTRIAGSPGTYAIGRRRRVSVTRAAVRMEEKGWDAKGTGASLSLSREWEGCIRTLRSNQRSISMQ